MHKRRSDPSPRRKQERETRGPTSQGTGQQMEHSEQLAGGRGAFSSSTRRSPLDCAGLRPARARRRSAGRPDRGNGYSLRCSHRSQQQQRQHRPCPDERRTTTHADGETNKQRVCPWPIRGRALARAASDGPCHDASSIGGAGHQQPRSHDAGKGTQN